MKRREWEVVEEFEQEEVVEFEEEGEKRVRERHHPISSYPPLSFEFK